MDNLAYKYTYEEWKKVERKQKAERLYYIKQKLFGLFIITISIICPFVMDGDATPSLLFVPLGLLFMFSKEKFML